MEKYFYLKNKFTNEIVFYKKDDFKPYFKGEFDKIIADFCVDVMTKVGIELQDDLKEAMFFMNFVNNWNNSKNAQRSLFIAINFTDLSADEQKSIINRQKNNEEFEKQKNQQRKHTVGNGEGSLFYSESQKKWIYQWTVGFDISGKQIKKQIKQKKNETKKDFLKRKTEIENSINNGTYIEKSKDIFIDITKRHVKQKHDDNITGDASYIRDLDTINEIEKTCSNFIYKPIQKITVEDIEFAKNKIKEYSNNSIKKIWRLLYKTFRIGVSRRKIAFNPMDDENLKRPISSKKTKKVTSLTLKEEALLNELLNNDTLNEQYRNIVLLQLNTGLRIGEILALSIDCIDFKNNTITIYRTLTKDGNRKNIIGEHTKTYDRENEIDNGKRVFPMSSLVKTILQDILKQKITNINQLLFWDYSRNSLILPKRINDFLKKLNKDNIIKDLTTHKLRHTFITRCQEKGISLSVLQAMVGHIEGSPVTEETYTSVSLEFMKEELKKIGG